MIADQMIARLEHLHSVNFIHRDIKPENFLVGTMKRSDQIYLIDYGLAKRFRDPRTGIHIPYTDNKSLTGTARYSSINAHLGIEQSRRDDLEAVGYVIMYLVRGSLPWQGLQTLNRKEKLERIREMKISIPDEVLCEGYPEFEQYMKYVRGLRFEEKPDYAWIRQLFKDMFNRANLTNDLIWDWVLKNTGKLLPAPSTELRPPTPQSYNNSTYTDYRRGLTYDEVLSGNDNYILPPEKSLQG
eukprot:TRINITY_DN3053_c0_g1_i1.p1 TRINITY_DN3053_c0_g1~~TRINITY_DN3053_c0_g1_i1.p1  ORF type:complete len:242 (+),score=32.48 TRINITY_DN3053_c0_g1_i1:493-1218(+)